MFICNAVCSCHCVDFASEKQLALLLVLNKYTYAGNLIVVINIFMQLLNPMMDVHSYHELMSAIRLLVSEDQCGGRFVFNRQTLQPSYQSPAAIVAAQKPALIYNTESGPGGDNSKSQLQTLLTRAGYAAPSYKTKQLKNNQFRSTVEFNGMQIMGQPCNNKKLAEKDAAAEALQWLLGRNGVGHDYIDHMSMLLKKSKKDHR